MSVIETRYEHIVVTDQEISIIADTTMKVIELVVEIHAYGWSAEELHFQHPYLSLGQIYSALAYYWDHKEVLDHDIAQRAEKVAVLQQRTAHTPLQSRIQAQRGS